MRLNLSDKLFEMHRKRRISAETYEDLTSRYYNYLTCIAIWFLLVGLGFGLWLGSLFL